MSLEFSIENYLFFKTLWYFIFLATGEGVKRLFLEDMSAYHRSPFPPLFRNFLGCYEVAKDPNEKTIPHVEQTHFLLSSTWAIISSTLSARATWWLVSWFCGGRSRRHSDFRGYTRYRGTPTQPVTCHQFLQTSNTV